MISREILEDPMYLSERFTRMQAFTDLCYLATFKERTFMIRGNKVTIKQGQVAKSVRDLACRWQWSVNTVMKFIAELKEGGYIDTHKTSVNQIITVKKYLLFNTQNDTQNDTQDDTQSDTQNDTYYNIDNIDKKEKKEDTNVSKKERLAYPKEFEADFVLYQRKGSKKKAYERWKHLSDEDKELMRKHIPFYWRSNERQYLKDFEGYINQRAFESPVTDRNGNILYDPDINPTSDYRPNGYYVRYMERDDYYLYIGSYPDAFFSDGYKDTDRPNGATLVLNNARGTLTWKAATKIWELTR